jgi:hypothetical protein
MKEKLSSIIVILSFIFFPAILQGQSSQKESGQGLSLGLKGGVNLSSWSNVVVVDPIKKVFQKGFQGGLLANIGFSKNLSLQFEFLYAQKGLRVEVPQFDDSGQETIYNSWHSVNYLEIPFLLKISIPIGPIFIYGDLGPYAAIGLSAETATDPDLGRNKKLDFSLGGFKKYDLGLIFGAGMGLRLGNGELFLDLRYGCGLTDINNVLPAWKDAPNYIEYNNRNIALSMGYLFQLGK